MTKKKIEPVVYHGNLMDHIDVNAMIRIQANTQTGTLNNSKNNGNGAPKVKTKGYVRINQPKK